MSSHGNCDEDEPTSKRVKTQHQGENEVDIESMQAEWNELDPVASLELYLQAQRSNQLLQQQMQQLLEREQEQRDLIQGTFYATFDEVWAPVPVSFDESHYDAMKRVQEPKYQTLDTEMPFPFQETMEKANDPKFDPAEENKSSRNSNKDSARKMKIWPVDVFNSKYDYMGNPGNFLFPHGIPSTKSVLEPVDPRQAPADAHVAHLIPAAPRLASLHYHVAIWVYGRALPRNPPPQLVQKLIHGSRPSTEQSGEPRKRATGTGLKHMICNKIRLAGQGPYFDNNPCLIIVPLLSLKQAKEWKGQGYHAVAMISKGSTNEREGERLHDVAAAVRMQDKGDEASEEELEVAKDLLTATVKALAFSVLSRPEKDSEWLAELPNGEWANDWSHLRNAFSLITGKPKIKVPKVRRDNSGKRVRKITFAPAFEDSGRSRHPAPDPLLLTVKAGLNWTAFHGQKLMPAADDQSDSDLFSERSLAAMDEHLEMIEQHERAKRHEELMTMTINIA